MLCLISSSRKSRWLSSFTNYLYWLEIIFSGATNRVIIRSNIAPNVQEAVLFGIALASAHRVSYSEKQ